MTSLRIPGQIGRLAGIERNTEWMAQNPAGTDLGAAISNSKSP
jgi:hypothetical protein